jgi:hypothetical protein
MRTREKPAQVFGCSVWVLAAISGQRQTRALIFLDGGEPPTRGFMSLIS